MNYEQLWLDAYRIAWIGASNPKGVRHTIDRYLAAGVAADHTAIRAMQGHLDYLNGIGLGPESDVLTEVKNRQDGSK